MRFCWITLNVKNMEESLKFYQEAIGLKVVERFSPNKEMEIAMLGEENGTKVELICTNTFQTRSEGISVGFEVNSLEEAMERMKEKEIPIKRGPFSPVPSSRFFFVEDPNGIEIQIVQNIH